MAWVRGESLARRLRRDGPLPTADVRRLAREMGWALAYAHERGVVHRDVKPGNILVEDVSGRFLLTDFGIARLADDAQTPVHGVLGTARYMAPEQALGEVVDGRADLYALGVTLHLAATGRAPFEGDAPAALLAQHATQPPAPIATRAPRLSPVLAQAIDRCLAKAPNDRFASAEAFLAAIALDDAQEAPTAPHLRPVRRHLTEAATVLGWAGVVYATGMLVAFAEGTGIGASITRSVVTSLATLMGVFAGIRGGQALYAARRALRLGHSRDELDTALAPSDLVAETSLRSATTWLGAGALLALANPTLTNVDFARFLERVAEAVGVPLGVGAAIETLVGLTITLAPLLCLAKGGTQLVSRWRATLERPLLAPARRLFTRLAAWRVPMHAARVLPSSDRTELRLDRDVAAAVAALAPAQRAQFADVPALARELAEQIGTLRADVARLAGELAEAAHDSAAHATLHAAHTERLERLETAIAALEQLRLDILALPSETATGTLTLQVDRVHDIARRVAAQLDVDRLLARTPTPT
jgi:serine/threonine-protein kinase